MRETWLKTNKRIVLMGMILPAVLVVVGLIVVVAKPLSAAPWLQVAAWGLVALGMLLLAVLAIQLRTPRLCYADGVVRVSLRSGEALPVPVEVIECFFLGAGAGQIGAKRGHDVPLRNLVARLAEKATDYHQRDVKPALGKWEDGYITVYGAWCEPLTLEVVKRLNAQLAAAHRQCESAREATAGKSP